MRAPEPFRTWITLLAAAAWITGCTGDDASGGTEAGSSGSSTGDLSGVPPTTQSPDDGGDDDGMDSTSATSAATPTGTGGTSGSESDTADDDTSDSTGIAACDRPPELPLLLMAADAVVEKPMLAIASMTLPDETVYARSDVQDAGTVTFTFELECDHEVILQGLVWDRFAGFDPQNPDSFYISVDDEDPEGLFPYGCQTQGNEDSLWSWEPVVPLVDEVCGEIPGVYSLSAGEHTVRLRNREGGFGDDFAGVAALVVTDDANLDPTTVFDPYPEE